MYKVNLEVFQGPLDLLLHLIEKMEIDIHNIPIKDLTESYLNYLHSLEEISLQNAEEYIVMASTLIHLKSKSLLPKLENSNDDLEEEIFVQNLIEYKNYKELSLQFYELYEKRQNMGDKEPTEININFKLGNIKIEKLYKSFKNLIELKKIYIDETLKIKYRKEVNIEETKKYIRKYLKEIKKIKFTELMKNYYTKEELVVGFLSILDLISKNEIIYYELGEDIIIEVVNNF